jgi:uncharacterized protein (TIRG00374 family)
LNKREQKIQAQQEEVLKSIRISKIIIPVILGFLVIGYLLFRKFDPDEFKNISWNNHALFWIFMTVMAYVVRHLAYSWRLRVLSDYEFSWSKSIELIFIWEFASAVSPTSLGGSAVALVLLAQEKLSSAKTVTIVIYSIVVDTIFFVLTLPILYLILGSTIIRPDMINLRDIDGWGVVFFATIAGMLIYGGLFFYGLFIKPVALKRFLLLLSKIRFLGKFRDGLRQTAMDVVVTAKELKKKSVGYHINVLLSTSIAWICRFLAINFVVIALISTVSTEFLDQLLLYARNQTMFAVTIFSPTPGGAGVAEAVFGDFLTDFVPEGVSTILAFIWRVITYYSYLIIGVIVIPNWIRNIINRRKVEKSH